jgi:hypothetical protein
VDAGSVWVEEVVCGEFVSSLFYGVSVLVAVGAPGLTGDLLGGGLLVLPSVAALGGGGALGVAEACGGAGVCGAACGACEGGAVGVCAGSEGPGHQAWSGWWWRE